MSSTQHSGSSTSIPLPNIPLPTLNSGRSLQSDDVVSNSEELSIQTVQSAVPDTSLESNQSGFSLSDLGNAMTVLIDLTNEIAKGLKREFSRNQERRNIAQASSSSSSGPDSSDIVEIITQLQPGELVFIYDGHVKLSQDPAGRLRMDGKPVQYINGKWVEFPEDPLSYVLNLSRSGKYVHAWTHECVTNRCWRCGHEKHTECDSKTTVYGENLDYMPYFLISFASQIKHGIIPNCLCCGRSLNCDYDEICNCDVDNILQTKVRKCLPSSFVDGKPFPFNDEFY